MKNKATPVIIEDAQALVELADQATLEIQILMPLTNTKPVKDEDGNTIDPGSLGIWIREQSWDSQTGSTNRFCIPILATITGSKIQSQETNNFGELVSVGSASYLCVDLDESVQDDVSIERLRELREEYKGFKFKDFIEKGLIEFNNETSETQDASAWKLNDNGLPIATPGYSGSYITFRIYNGARAGGRGRVGQAYVILTPSTDSSFKRADTDAVTTKGGLQRSFNMDNASLPGGTEFIMATLTRYASLDVSPQTKANLALIVTPVADGGYLQNNSGWDSYLKEQLAKEQVKGNAGVTIPGGTPAPDALNKLIADATTGAPPVLETATTGTAEQQQDE